MSAPSNRFRAWGAALAYTGLTLLMTWPLALGLSRDVPWDLGDALLNMWILAWDAEQARAIAAGDARIGAFFDANIFYPAPLALAYSEHLVAQALQVLPVYAATANPILCYNLLFLSTFVLSGLGTFLLVRELTGRADAAFLAGLLFAFAPYRFAQVSHLQVLSAHWMPFALYAFRRYFETRRVRALAGAAAALVLQNLSCGYFMLYFAPLVAVYVLWEIAARGLLGDRRVWAHLAVAAAAAAAATLPFVLPYKQLRDTLHLSRDLTEVVRFSADVYSYATASPANHVWGDLVRAYPKREGELFPGLIPLLLAAAALVTCAIRAARVDLSHQVRRRLMPVWVPALLAAIGLAYGALLMAAIFTRRIDVDLGPIAVRASNATRLVVVAAAAFAASLALAPRARARLVAAARTPEAIFSILLLLAWWLSLGPAPRVFGRTLELWSPYRVLYDYVPGYAGVRVPARFAMLVASMLATLAGLGAARFGRGMAARVILGGLAAAFLLESHTLPFQLNGVAPLREFATPEPRVHPPATAPPVYRAVARLPDPVVLLEMPFGQSDYDVRAVYYSTAHWKRLVNGYSGFFPPHYRRLEAVLRAAPRAGDVAWNALRDIGVTHVLVHEDAYLDDEGQQFVRWLVRHGAVEVFRAYSDVLLALPR